MSRTDREEGSPKQVAAEHRRVAGGERRGGRHEGERVRAAGVFSERAMPRGAQADPAMPGLLSIQHFRVLGCLEALAKRTSAVSLELLAGVLDLAPPTVVRIVRDLEHAGLRVLRWL